MIGIEQMSNKIATFLADNTKDYTQSSRMVADNLNKEYKLFNRQEAIDTWQFGLECILGDMVKTGIILVIGVPLHIVLPAICIMLGFCLLRLLAGGVHMDNYTKCLSTGSMLFLIPAWFIQHYNSSLNILDVSIYSIIVLMLSVISSLYAPVDNENKPIKELKKKELKLKSIIFILAVGVIITVISNNIIKFSLLLGIGIEVFTITPIGIKLFNKLESIIDKTVITIKNLKGKRI